MRLRRRTEKSPRRSPESVLPRKVAAPRDNRIKVTHPTDVVGQLVDNEGNVASAKCFVDFLDCFKILLLAHLGLLVRMNFMAQRTAESVRHKLLRDARQDSDEVGPLHRACFAKPAAIWPQVHFGADFDRSRLDPVTKVGREMFRSVHLGRKANHAVRVWGFGLVVRSAGQGSAPAQHDEVPCVTWAGTEVIQKANACVFPIP
jgi:hypothetical protein